MAVTYFSNSRFVGRYTQKGELIIETPYEGEPAQPLQGGLVARPARLSDYCPPLVPGVDYHDHPNLFCHLLDRLTFTIKNKLPMSEKKKIPQFSGTLLIEDPPYLVLTDKGPWNVHPSLTNAVEELIKAMKEWHILPGEKIQTWRLVYYDTQGVLDEILLDEDNNFDGFNILTQEERDEIEQRIKSEKYSG